jgi:hypothetical protein
MTGQRFDTDMGGKEREFPSTLWTMIREAADRSSPDCQEQLNRLLKRYWKPVYAYIQQGWKKPVEECKDLTQEFLLRMLEGEYFPKAAPDKGSCRASHKPSLQHFPVRPGRREGAKKRGGDKAVVLLEDEDVSKMPSDSGQPPEEAFDAQWVSCVLDEGVQALKEVLHVEGKDLYFEVFTLFYIESVDAPKEGEPPVEWTHPRIAQRLGIKASDVANYLSYGRRKLRELLGSRVKDYVATEEDERQELDFVLGSES